MARMKKLGVENALLKKAVKPSQRKAVAQLAVANRNVTIRIHCVIFFINETCYRYQPVNDDENA